MTCCGKLLSLLDPAAIPARGWNSTVAYRGSRKHLPIARLKRVAWCSPKAHILFNQVR
jgi:hypothetical protein